MAKKNYPEQRSPRADSAGSQTPAQPTGGETFKTDGSPEPEAEVQRSAEELQAEVESLAGGYYKKLAETTNELADEARQLYNSGASYMSDNPSILAGGAFLVGLALGMITYRR